MFVARNHEIRSLQRELDRKRPSLIVVYGRRRVGKSTLLAQATKDRRTIYFQATQVLGSVSLGLFRDEIERVLGTDPVLAGIANWEALLSYVSAAAATRPGLTLVLDEFPYLCESVEGLPSIVQKVFDRATADGTSWNLVLCGSQISFMEALLGERNPLRGRQTMELELAPLTYREAAAFFDTWSPQEQLTAYGIFGGLPYYLQLCDSEGSLRENVEDVILRPGAPLGNEASNVLRAELQSPSRYASILHAIADGCVTTGEIVGRAVEISDGRALGPYLVKLQSLRLVRAERSLDAPPKARNTRFAIADPFLAFWYRFVLPNLSPLTAGDVGQVYDHAIEPHLSDYMGRAFEEIARQWAAHYASELLPSAFREVGKIWGADYDVDVAGTLLDGTTVFGECKWTTRKVGRSVLDELRGSAGKTTYGAGEPRFLLFSRAGFTKNLEREKDLVVIDPAALMQAP